MDEDETGNPWKLMYRREQCNLDVTSCVWSHWYAELDKRGFYNIIQASSSYVVSLLIEKGINCCLQYLQRLENEWNLSYEEFVYRLSFTTHNYKSEDFDIVTLSGKIKKDINGCIVPAKTDHVAIYLEGLRNFVRKNVPNFERLGAQADRTRISGIIYQLTVECGDPKLADVCLMFGLKNYSPDTTYRVIGDMIAYFLASYRILQERQTQFGTQFNLSAAHVAVMREDYHAFAALPYREDDLWRPGGCSCALPVELSAYNAIVCPSRASILTFIICGIISGLLDGATAPLTWDNNVYMRVRNVHIVLKYLLYSTHLYKIAEVEPRSESFFGTTINNPNVRLSVKDSGVYVDCKDYVSENAIRQVWRLYQESCKKNIPFNKQGAVDILMHDEADKKRCQSLRVISSMMKYEGNVDYIRKSLRPQHAHYCGKLMDIGNFLPVSFTDNRLLLRCGVFRGIFTRLAYNARGVCGVISPHCLFDVSDIYSFMSLLTLLDSDDCLNSFVRECKDAKQRLTGNGTRSKKKY